MKTKISVICLIAMSVLAGCSTKFNSGYEDREKTKIIYEEHAKSIDGNVVTKSESSWLPILNRTDDRLMYEDDLRLPNPELEMVYFSKRNEDGSIMKGYVAKFAMYERVHYQVGL